MSQQEGIKLLRKHDFKITHKRLAIIEFFEVTDGYRPPKALYSFMEGKYPGISYDTVYRNLHLYHRIGLLESTTLQGEKHFRLRCSHEHHHHFICNICGFTKEIDVCPMENITPRLAGYKIQDHKFEIYGTCSDCQAQ